MLHHPSARQFSLDLLLEIISIALGVSIGLYYLSLAFHHYAAGVLSEVLR